MANVHAHSFGLNRARTVRVSALLAVALAVFSMLSLVFGSSEIPCADIFSALFFGGENETAKLVLWEIRLPRLCAAMLCGSSLAVAGVGMQSLFRNPLADPSVTGVSSGAALGAVIVYGLWRWALRSRQVTQWLKCSEQDKGLIRHTAPFRHTGWVIAVGGLTIAAVAVWSAVQIL